MQKAAKLKENPMLELLLLIAILVGISSICTILSIKNSIDKRNINNILATITQLLVITLCIIGFSLNMLSAISCSAICCVICSGLYALQINMEV